MRSVIVQVAKSAQFQPQNVSETTKRSLVYFELTALFVTCTLTDSHSFLGWVSLRQFPDL